MKVYDEWTDRTNDFIRVLQLDERAILIEAEDLDSDGGYVGEVQILCSDLPRLIAALHRAYTDTNPDTLPAGEKP